jgi:hypothetical protein
MPGVGFFFDASLMIFDSLNDFGNDNFKHGRRFAAMRCLKEQGELFF